MSFEEEYTQDSSDATLVTHEIVPFRPLADDPFLICPDEPEADDISFLQTLGIGKPYIDACRERAKLYGATLEAELLASGLVAEQAYFGAFARYLRLPFFDDLDASIVVDTPSLDIQLLEQRMLRLSPRDAKPYIAVVPDIETISRLKAALETTPGLQADMVITTPSALKRAVWNTGAERRTRETINTLFENKPHYSSRITLEGKQGFCLGIAVTILILSLCLVTNLTLYALHAVTAFLYLAATLFRLSPLRTAPQRRTLRLADTSRNEPLPVYSVLVALYREEAVVKQLVAALDRLDWPKSRLDIKLVCEADDAMTLDAIGALSLGPQFEVVKVPPSLPRTKPKALNYALRGVRGQLLAVYDAEDRPHSKQLKEAYARFQEAPDTLACLQAPLIISNGDTSWLTSSFSLEYSALFRRMLPMLAKKKMPLPLGGTSNHFRTEVLRDVGAWDPHNVTEDADLGMRLYRMGYRCDVIHYPTLEDAPTDVLVWMKQRTRWFKGWLQSWLVMMRSPLATARQMGWRAYLVFHLLIGGMLLSSLTHPLFLIYVAYIVNMLWTEGTSSVAPAQLALFTIDTLNVLASYTIFLMMGLRGMIPHERKLIKRRWLFTPLYWLMLSAAAWHAVYELRYKPFVWNKTPHKPREPKH
ncbi:glycosyltransferase [Agrobacterium larrymoorei]|uniref:glycosyltransferase family 2 protein n=1 Tax=Agrobacterium larrymoorei TaxID=160699 RepID=UPI001573689C|nr:glycosyltransferase family 2 protein [Agrobacterium larrymoorei]NTJ41275.1 glycosyltransferase [Agrobacterium larrymoorei]